MLFGGLVEMNSNPAYVRRRTKEITDGVDQAYDALTSGRITDKRFHAIMDKAEAEMEQLRVAKRTRSKALEYAMAGDPSAGLNRWDGAKGVKATNLSPMDIPTS
jgi:hypothetical protein